MTTELIKPSLATAKGIVSYVANTVKASVTKIRASKKYKPFEFSIRCDTETEFLIFIKGTKTGMKDYERICDTVPVIHVKIEENLKSHPTKPLESWVSLTGYCTAYEHNIQSAGYKETGRLKELIDEALVFAIEQYTDQKNPINL